MCGIAAISIPHDSKINARELAHNLLKQIEYRGTHASGFAFYTADGKFGIYKNPRPGSQLSLAELPRNAKTVILHTRYATQGSTQDNRNNHPVISPDNRVALVHNGVISNDHTLRPSLGLTEEHGEVDSLVIPALLAQQGVDSLSQLRGYAAIAWIDGNQDGELHIARLKSSPVAYTHLLDGTFVMASTSELLSAAIDDTPHIYGGIFEMGEQKMMSVNEGFIYEHGKSPSMAYDHYSYSRHSSATSGGHGASSATTSATTGTTKGSEDSCDTMVSRAEWDLDEWRRERAAQDEKNAQDSRAMVMFGEDNSPDGWTDDEWDKMIQRFEEEEARFADGSDDAPSSTYGEGFYILDGEGDISHYPTLDDLEGALSWLAKMSQSSYDLFQTEDSLNWVNHIMDLGHVTDNGLLISWVDDTAEVDEFESPAVRNLQGIREGAGMLATLKGA